ncbi:MAG: putative cytochrome P450 [Candidatus Binatia bacterium]|nr:MAG: putative cytochrome P450 [Candidatus Binatia bacterium]
MSAPLVYDPYSYEIHEDPYPTYARLRAEAPVYYNAKRGFYALSRYNDVREAMQDWETFSSQGGVALEGSGKAPPMIIAMDPPRQTRLRRIISAAFTPRRVAEMEPRVRALAQELLQPLLRQREFDFVDDFSGKLPMAVIANMLGVPEADRETLRTWSDTLLHREPGDPRVTPAGVEAAGNIVKYFAEEIEHRRRHPGTDLLSALLEAEVEGERLSREEVLGFCFLLIIAGNETTTKMLANAVDLLYRHPQQRARLIREPERMADAVEEVLRFDPSTQALARVVRRDVTLHGTVVPAGARVLLLIGSANRDETVIERADEFDVFRTPVAHLAFGIGTHFCLGASLARLEGRVALEEVLRSMPEYELDLARRERVHSTNVRGYAHLPMSPGPKRRETVHAAS